jgi:hypothetical protein
MPHEVTVIKGRRLPTCRHCKGITFELAHAAKRMSARSSISMKRMLVEHPVKVVGKNELMVRAWPRT